MRTRRPVPDPAAIRSENADAGVDAPITADDVRLALAGIPLNESAQRVAEACVQAASNLLGPVRIHVPAAPLPIDLGSSRDDLVLLVRFPGLGGDGELWALADILSEPSRTELESQFNRIWTVQQDRVDSSREVDELRFHLSALQQVTHTLAVVRGTEETEQLVVDSTKEVFFAWWAALYRSDASGLDYVRRIDRTMRGEVLPQRLPAELVSRSLSSPKTPGVPPTDSPLRECFPADLGVLAPLDLGDGAGGLIVLGARMTDAPFSTPDVALLRALADASAVALRNSKLMERLRTEAVRDALTGCQNRRGFDDALATESMRARRYQRPLSLIVLDIDHFKVINDTFGHAVGDHALRLLGRTLVELFRKTDTACRIGGEEFALIFPETPKHESFRLAERARLEIAAIPSDHVLPHGLTVSLGVASYPEDGNEPDALLRAADRALYRAKAAGRNRSELARAEDARPPAKPDKTA